ncbi:hypothetical protein HK104_004653, partial [Borealophlyctis nickersoniae]
MSLTDDDFGFMVPPHRGSTSSSSTGSNSFATTGTRPQLSVSTTTSEGDPDHPGSISSADGSISAAHMEVPFPDTVPVMMMEGHLGLGGGNRHGDEYVHDAGTASERFDIMRSVLERRSRAAFRVPMLTVAVAGDSAIGKTTLLRRLASCHDIVAHDPFPELASTVTIEHYRATTIPTQDRLPDDR